jgi:hypothetical protein
MEFSLCVAACLAYRGDQLGLMKQAQRGIDNELFNRQQLKKSNA